MPWQESTPMSQRREFVQLASREGANVRELCRRFQISPTTGYARLRRYAAEGEAGLGDRSRRPHTSPARTGSAMEAAILALRRFEHDAAHELWQMDFMGHRPLDQGRVHPLTILDDHSRFLLHLTACATQQREVVQTHLTACFRQYGLSRIILTDNGPPWGTSGAGGSPGWRSG